MEAIDGYIFEFGWVFVIACKREKRDGERAERESVREREKRKRREKRVSVRQEEENEEGREYLYSTKIKGKIVI